MNSFCWLYRRRLDAYADGELPAGARARVERHVGRCQACATEAASAGRLRALLAGYAPEPPGPVWDAFWPQVRARLAAPAALEPEPRWRWLQDSLAGHRRLAIGSALAAGALGVLAVLAPWRPMSGPLPVPVVQAPESPAPDATPAAPAAQLSQVVVQSVESADPQSSVMVFTPPESDVTIVWVFGLARTES